MFSLFKKSTPLVIEADPIGKALIATTASSEVIEESYVNQLLAGTAAERSYGQTLSKKLSEHKWTQWALQRSQEIDLISLLKMRTKDKMPVWSFVSPYFDLQESFVYGNGDYRIPSNYRDVIRIHTSKKIGGLESEDKLRAKSFPLLPDRVKEMIKTSGDVYKNAEITGILYKESDWQLTKAPEQKPDPALIVQWKGIPNKFFCLAIWGGDRAEIQEFVKSCLF